jgi:hypothetical protein
MMPSEPPRWIHTLLLASKSLTLSVSQPIVRTRKVKVRKTNTASTAPDTRMAPTVMYAVKTVQTSR